MEKSLFFVKKRVEAFRGLWVPATRDGDTGIGHTFEKVVLGKEEDNIGIADMNGLEIKTKDVDSNAMLTLFTKAPTHFPNANTFIRETFGEATEFGTKTLYVTVSSSKTVDKNGNSWWLNVKDFGEKLSLCVMGPERPPVLPPDNIYWSYDFLRWIIREKIKDMCLVEADRREVNGQVYFRYHRVTLLLNASVWRFLTCVEAGDIVFEIRMGVHKSGSMAGKPHDHGGGFRIAKRNFHKLYEHVQVLEV